MTARRLLHRAAGVSGLARLARSAFRQRPLVLCYHAVCASKPDVSDIEGMQVSRELFEKQMLFLLRHYRPVTLEQVRSHLEGAADLPRNAVLITFDDGYRNVLENALPILRRLGVPCAMFLVAGLVGGRRSIWTAELELRRRDDPNLRALKRQLKGMPKPRRAEALRVLLPGEAWLPVCDISLGTWDEIRPWIGPDVAVGSHGSNHEPLSTCDDDSLAHELRHSREQIEKSLGVSVIALAYPDGDTSTRVVDAARRAGYSLAFSTVPRHLRGQDDRFLVPRILVGAQDREFVLESRLSGWLEWLKRA